jgi:hypothetical protein
MRKKKKRSVTTSIVVVEKRNGIEVILKLFSKEGLTKLFEQMENVEKKLSENSRRIISLEKRTLRVPCSNLFVHGKWKLIHYI